MMREHPLGPRTAAKKLQHHDANFLASGRMCLTHRYQIEACCSCWTIRSRQAITPRRGGEARHRQVIVCSICIDPAIRRGVCPRTWHEQPPCQPVHAFCGMGMAVPYCRDRETERLAPNKTVRNANDRGPNCWRRANTAPFDAHTQAGVGCDRAIQVPSRRSGLR
jgi:hypothetical protein